MNDLKLQNLSIYAALDLATISVILVDARCADQPITFVNRAFTQLTGYSSVDAIGRNCRFLQGPLTDPSMVNLIRRTLAEGTSITCEMLNYKKDGSQFWNGLTIDPIHDSDGNVSHFLAFQQDVSGARLAASELHVAEEKLASIIQNIPGYIFRRIMRPDLTVHYTFFSRSIFRILGLPDDTEWQGTEFLSYIHADDRANFRTAIVQSGLELTRLRSEFRLISTLGGEHWFRSDSTPRAAANGDIVWEGLAADVSAEKASESQLTYLAHHDILTGLANRQLFRMSVIEAISSAALTTSSVAVCYIDLDDFQTLNEELGLAVGDLMLQQVGGRLLGFVKRFGGAAARLGGDEFALLLPAINRDADLLVLAESLRLSVLQPVAAPGRDIVTDVCIGGVLYGNDDPASCSPDERAAELMKRADLALRRAKQEGPGSCRIYSPSIDDRVRNRMALRRSLHDGLANEQFALHFQPLVDLCSGEIVGAEALVRWNHPELGLQRPDLFIPYAEASGLIVPLGAWIMKKAMQQAEDWRKDGLAPPRIAINLSGIQLQRPGFVSSVERALDESGADASNFEFELTEGTLIGAASETYRELGRLRSLGFGLAIDDFGTGHSTLKSLRDFPVNKIKIDQTFIRQLVVNSTDASIIRAIVALSQSMKLDVVAEGIETLMQRDFLLEEGCRVGQGYLLSMPLAAEDFAWLLETRQKLLPADTSGKDVEARQNGS